MTIRATCSWCLSRVRHHFYLIQERWWAWNIFRLYWRWLLALKCRGIVCRCDDLTWDCRWREINSCRLSLRLLLRLLQLIRLIVWNACTEILHSYVVIIYPRTTLDIRLILYICWLNLRDIDIWYFLSFTFRRLLANRLIRRLLLQDGFIFWKHDSNYFSKWLYLLFWLFCQWYI